jgi:hypothetical protein
MVHTHIALWIVAIVAFLANCWVCTGPGESRRRVLVEGRDVGRECVRPVRADRKNRGPDC